jgi:hypothetical protein
LRIIFILLYSQKLALVHYKTETVRERSNIWENGLSHLQLSKRITLCYVQNLKYLKGNTEHRKNSKTHNNN